MAVVKSSTEPDHRPVGGAWVDREVSGAVVRLWGEHDIASTQIVSTALSEALDDDTDVLIDLDEVTFMDCSIVKHLLACRARLTERGRRLTIRVSPSAFTYRLLVLCEVADLVETASITHDQRSGTSNALESWVEVPHAARDGALSSSDTSAAPPSGDEAATRPVSRSAASDAGTSVRTVPAAGWTRRDR